MFNNIATNYRHFQQNYSKTKEIVTIYIDEKWLSKRDKSGDKVNKNDLRRCSVLFVT